MKFKLFSVSGLSSLKDILLKSFPKFLTSSSLTPDNCFFNIIKGERESSFLSFLIDERYKLFLFGEHDSSNSLLFLLKQGENPKYFFPDLY